MPEWTSICLCLSGVFAQASPHILRASYSSDIGITTDAALYISDWSYLQHSIELVHLALIGNVWMCMYGQVAESNYRLMNMFNADGKPSTDAFQDLDKEGTYPDLKIHFAPSLCTSVLGASAGFTSITSLLQQE